MDPKHTQYIKCVLFPFDDGAHEKFNVNASSFFDRCISKNSFTGQKRQMSSVTSYDIIGDVTYSDDVL